MKIVQTTTWCFLFLLAAKVVSAEESISAQEIVQRWLDRAEKTPLLRAEFLTVEKGSPSDDALPPLLFARGGFRPLIARNVDDTVGETEDPGAARIFHGMVTLENFHWRTDTWGEHALHGGGTSELHLVRLANGKERLDFWDWKDESQQSVGVRDKDSTSPARANEIRMWTLLFRPQVSVELSDVLDKLTLTSSRRTIDGEECLCLEQETPDGSANSVRVWVAPSKDYRIVALQQMKLDQLVRDIHVKYREHADIGFVPDSWEITDYEFTVSPLALPPAIKLPELPNLDLPEFPDVPTIEVLTPVQKQVDSAPVTEVPEAELEVREVNPASQTENAATAPSTPRAIRSSKTRVTSVTTDFTTADEFWELKFPEGVFQINSDQPIMIF
ncbi:MAG: hypothetical protein R3C18_12310 [Planctomycetaceae bacterium]